MKWKNPKLDDGQGPFFGYIPSVISLSATVFTLGTYNVMNRTKIEGYSYGKISYVITVI